MKDSDMYNEDPGDVSELSYKALCWRFIGRQRRLSNFEEFKAPQIIIDGEKKLIQRAYNQMRKKCMEDEEYRRQWEDES
jgi:hypothetical protein